MGYRLRVNCYACGEVDLNPEDVTLEPDVGYRFRCPSCEEIIQKDSDPRVEGLLRSVGAVIALTEDEVEEFAALLSTPFGDERIARELFQV